MHFKAHQAIPYFNKMLLIELNYLVNRQKFYINQEN